ncbi:hypothetical protein [Bacillus cereus]|uniref:Uncharacterized protein n=1 Tax=Bacillus cereus TaxID=1396 RepID=A0A164QDD3_BACCE|nr:hypothetical protein [Bacillus cereus]KZD71150.1 hypothetical protein B4088_0880 [Bacillus cereus]HDR8323406.1 hypothetical protein [Bacillus cereus]HDR8329611.1 hypothetical protein [Bacillus cereus]HDR8336301.1 hypothetical protein [Bacillus cereus]
MYTLSLVTNVVSKYVDTNKERYFKLIFSQFGYELHLRSHLNIYTLLTFDINNNLSPSKEEAWERFQHILREERFFREGLKVHMNDDVFPSPID